MADPELGWIVTITYKDGTALVFHAKDLDEFHWKMVPCIRNRETGSPMSAVLIH